MTKNSSPFEQKAFFDVNFHEDLKTWIEIDCKVALKVMDLVDAVLRNLFAEIGKPEPLKCLDSYIWSHRITQEHRLVYLISKDSIEFLQCRYP